MCLNKRARRMGSCGWEVGTERQGDVADAREQTVKHGRSEEVKRRGVVVHLDVEATKENQRR